ncbi:YciI family protein [Kribbella sp. CA-247076]|uniref:YciI family protein n=1 Tax=Kribbella sp. CA-247076 TaxID=3239941 RepID=UPI003D92BF8C
MKFLLILQSDTDRHDPCADLRRDAFEHTAYEAGELVGGEVLADPELAVTVPGRARATAIDAYYVIDVESPARAIELANLLPDTRTPGRSVEIRAVMHSTAVDL